MPHSRILYLLENNSHLQFFSKGQIKQDITYKKYDKKKSFLLPSLYDWLFPVSLIRIGIPGTFMKFFEMIH